MGDARIDEGGGRVVSVEANARGTWKGVGENGGFLEGGSRSPRGRTRASATHTRTIHTQCLQHRRVHGGKEAREEAWKRTRALQRRCACVGVRA